MFLKLTGGGRCLKFGEKGEMLDWAFLKKLKYEVDN